MPTLLVAAPNPLSGKTTTAVALARLLAKSGMNVSLARLGDDASAAADAATFASLAPAAGGTPIVELPAGGLSAAGDIVQKGGRVIVVATPESAAEASALAEEAGSALAGVVLNRARKSVDIGGVTPFVVVPADAALAAPGLSAVGSALEAETENIDGGSVRSLGRLVIASIAADPGQAYFDRTRADSVIVRSDKPDLQLAALNAGAECLIVTGDLPVLSYVRDRVEAEEVPFMRTPLDTKEAVEAIEGLFGAAPFAADAGKLRRLDELFAGADVNALLGAA
jgi:hypothetical protein